MAKPTIPTEPLDPLIREALGWILRLTSGDATSADSDRLSAWRTSAPERERAFREAVKCWRALAPALRESRMSQAPLRQVPLGQVPLGQAPLGQAPLSQATSSQTSSSQTTSSQAPSGQAPSGQNSGIRNPGSRDRPDQDGIDQANCDEDGCGCHHDMAGRR
ncbi:FecR/PupR family sigma factor regulator [Rhodopseudomonas sp. NSM]|uniref:FecR/PupR family sigma factor regulator n=1 Tax=Rhodopseudomonas sp. NSM TaxID=3457630 RepID=UPI004035A56F